MNNLKMNEGRMNELRKIIDNLSESQLRIALNTVIVGLPLLEDELEMIIESIMLNTNN